MSESSPCEPPSAVPVYTYDAGRSGFSYALKDLKAAVSQPSLIITLVRSGFIGRNSGLIRTVFWTIATTSAIALGLGLLYGQIIGRLDNAFLPYVGAGIITWGLVSSAINDGAGVFVAARGVYGQTPISKSLFALRSVGILTLVFILKMPVLIGLLWYAQVTVTPISIVFSLAGVGLILWISFWFALGWGIVAARFNDVLQLTSTLVTFSFFVTPIFWDPSRLGPYKFIVDFNPLYHLINTVRGPLLGLDGIVTSFIWAGGVAVIMPVAGFTLFGLFARRLNYWS